MDQGGIPKDEFWTAAAMPPPAGGVAGPTGPGWVIELTGHHFHNEEHHKPDEKGNQFIRSTIVRNFSGEGRPFSVAAGPLAGKTVPLAALGIGFPVIVSSSPVESVKVVATQQSRSSGQQPAAPEDPSGKNPDELALKRQAFVLQFSWQPTIPAKP